MSLRVDVPTMAYLLFMQMKVADSNPGCCYAMFVNQQNELGKQPRPLSCLFLAFSNKQYNFYNKSMRKMSFPFNIWHRNSNPQPLEHESTHITTRPGLPYDTPKVVI